MQPPLLTSFGIQNYYQNDVQLGSKKKLKFNGVYSRNNLPKTKDETCVINLDDYKSIGTHWMALYVNNNGVTYFGSFSVEDIPK